MQFFIQTPLEGSKRLPHSNSSSADSPIQVLASSGPFQPQLPLVASHHAAKLPAPRENSAMHRGRLFAAIVLVLATCIVNVAVGQLREQSPEQQPALEETPSRHLKHRPLHRRPIHRQQKTKEKLARVWANEPPLVRLARDKFGAELTETDAKFFAAVADNKWADLRPTSKTTYNSEEPASWKGSAKLRADRLIWLLRTPPP